MTTLDSDPNQQGLFEPGSSAPITEYAKRVWHMRYYALAEAKGKLEASHAENVLGRLWLLIEPALFIATYYLLFGVLLNAERGLESSDFLAYLATGKLSYGFMRRGIMSGAGALSSDQALRASNSMPKAVYPLAQMLNAALAYRYEIVVMVLFVVMRGVRPRLSWLLLLPLAVLAFGFIFGSALILVRMISNFADLRSALPQLLLLGMYTSGVIFPVEQYILGRDNDELLLHILSLNPFYAIVKLNQWAAMGYKAPEFDWVVWSALGWGLLLPIIGLAWFIRAERRYSSAIYAG